MADAVFIAGGSAYDAIIVKNGVVMVDAQMLSDFLQGGDFDDWEASWGWEGLDVDFDEEFLFDAAIDVAESIGGKIAAYWSDGKLTILDNELLQESLEFYRLKK